MARLTLLRIALIGTIALSAWHLVQNATSRPEMPPDLIGVGYEIYASLTYDLPASGRIGFLPTSTEPTFNAANHYVAQYALAPRVVVTEVKDARFVISGVDAPPALDLDPRVAGYELAAVRTRGIRIYRRSGP